MSRKKVTHEEFFRALANEQRLEILKRIGANKTMTYDDIEKIYHIGEAVLTHHLNYMFTMGILKRKKRFNTYHYFINEETILKMFKKFETMLKIGVE